MNNTNKWSEHIDGEPVDMDRIRAIRVALSNKQRISQEDKAYLEAHLYERSFAPMNPVIAETIKEMQASPIALPEGFNEAEPAPSSAVVPYSEATRISIDKALTIDPSTTMNMRGTDESMARTAPAASAKAKQASPSYIVEPAFKAAIEEEAINKYKTQIREFIRNGEFKNAAVRTLHLAIAQWIRNDRPINREALKDICGIAKIDMEDIGYILSPDQMVKECNKVCDLYKERGWLHAQAA